MNEHNIIILTQFIYYTEPESRIPDKGEEKDTFAASSVQTAAPECEEFGPRLPPPG